MDPNLQPFGHSHCHKLPASAWTCPGPGSFLRGALPIQP